MADSTNAVNSQVTDAVTQTNVSVLGESPAQSMGMVYQSMAQSISLLMQNGVSNQGGMQQINAAVIATACREIMAGSQPKPQSPPPDGRNIELNYIGSLTSAGNTQESEPSDAHKAKKQNPDKDSKPSDAHKAEKQNPEKESKPTEKKDGSESTKPAPSKSKDGHDDTGTH